MPLVLTVGYMTYLELSEEPFCKHVNPSEIVRQFPTVDNIRVRLLLLHPQVMGNPSAMLVQWSDANGVAKRYTNGIQWFGTEVNGRPQDDIEVISTKLTRLNQPAGATVAAATPVCNVPPPGISTCTLNNGGTVTDVVVQSIMTKSPAEQPQVFSFIGSANDVLGDISVETVRPLRSDWIGRASSSSMLNVNLELLGTDGTTVLASADPAVTDGTGAGQGAQLPSFLPLPATGTYYLRVSPTGEANKFPSFGSIGEFTLKARIPPQAPVNNRPQAVDDSATAPVNQEITINVLTNDIGGTGTVTVTSVTSPTTLGGTAVIGAFGQAIIYTAPPKPGAVRIDDLV
jgi:hypothetical protein